MFFLSYYYYRNITIITIANVCCHVEPITLQEHAQYKEFYLLTGKTIENTGNNYV